MRERWPVLLFACVMVAIPLIPGVPPFWIGLLDNIGLSALVAMGLVLLTGVGGRPSVGQGAFWGLSALATPRLAHGLRPFARAYAATVARRERPVRGGARPHHGTIIRPLSAARLHRLGA